MLLPSGTIFRRDNSSSDFSEEKQQLDHLKSKCECILFKTKTVFPFDFFPSDLIIDSEKVSIIMRVFFGSGQIHCIPIKNITDLSLEHSIFLATLHILPGRVFQNQVLTLGHLKREDALKARNLIQGLMIIDRENINLNNTIHNKEWIDEIEAIGKAG